MPVDVGPVVTLMVAGKPLTFSTRVEGCLPPHVSVPTPGPCPGGKRARKGAQAVKRAVIGRRKAVADRATEDKVERVRKAYQAVLDIAMKEDTEVEPDLMPDIAEILKTVKPMNLKHLQIKGKGNENLFQHALRDIPRDQMPALPDTVEKLKPLMEELTQRGVKFEIVEIDPRELQAIQTELGAHKVAKLAEAMKGGWSQDGVMVISKDKAVGDGHHRWAAAALASMLHEQGVPGYKPMKVRALQIDLDVDDMLAVMEKYSGPKKSMTEAA